VYHDQHQLFFSAVLHLICPFAHNILSISPQLFSSFSAHLPQYSIYFLSPFLLVFCPFALNTLPISSPLVTSQRPVVDVLIVGESAGG
jgi:hypothetical protein